MRILQLLRHAKSNWDGPAGDDHGRVLAPRGQRAATLVGVHLAQQDAAPELVLCSTARRAVETWERAAAQLPHPPPVELDEALYLASPAQILARVQRVDAAVRRVLVVGHNPGFQALAVQLAGGPGSEGAARVGKFATGALATFSLRRGGWAELDARATSLTDFVRPADLV
jgi:phosphohistidine phosphatase